MDVKGLESARGQAANATPRCVRAPRAFLGEAPLWDPTLAVLHWVDCDRKRLFRLDPRTGEVGDVALPHNPGSYAFRAGGGMIMAYRNQLALIDEDPARARSIETPGVDFAVERFNDGACDRRGRFWVGTMDRHLKEPVGALFRVDPDLSVHRMAGGLICSNGIAFSPDDAIMYHADTSARRIYAYDFDLDDGTIANQRVFADFAGEAGRPDGCTIDAEGYLWVAAVRGAAVMRFDPAGRRLASVAMPVTAPTSVMFGGTGLRTLYITSGQHGLTPEQLAQQPEAGCLFSFEVETPGLPEPRFAG